MNTYPRKAGLHHHYTANLADFQAALASGLAASGVVASGLAASGIFLPPGGAIGQSLLKNSGDDGAASWHDIEDMATSEFDSSLVLAPDGAGGVEFRVEAGGGGTPHDLLDGTENQDTLTGSVVAGDVIIGNDTPKWARLARSVPGAVHLFNFFGITNGETTPSWKALFDTTNPSTQAFGDAAAVGTADVAAHRDHKHAMPASPAAYATVQDEGTPLTQRSTVNFVGAGVSAADSGGVTTVTISGGTGGGGSVANVRSYISFGSNMTGQAYTP